ncbi:NAD kinase [Bradyrhizobium sp. GM2.2]
MAADLSALDLLVVQIDGLHLGDDLVLATATGSTAKSKSIRGAGGRGDRIAVSAIFSAR